MALMVAVVLGVLSIVLIRQYVQKLQDEFRATLALKPAYVAARDLPPGTVIGDNEIATADFPGAAMERMFGASRITDKNTILGAKVVTQVSAGQVFTRQHFPDISVGAKNTLRNKFGREYRALTIGMDTVRGVAGMLRPGDYVDLHATITFTAADSDQQSSVTVTRTILKNVLILATGDKLAPEDVRPGESYSSLTLRVLPKDANRLLFVLTKGGTLSASYVQQGAPEDPGWSTVSAEVLWDEIRGEFEAIVSRGG